MMGRALSGSLILTAVIVGLGNNPVAARKAKRPVAHARADTDPPVRIRGLASDAELTPLQFAHWLKRQSPDLLQAAGMPGLQNISMRTQLLNRTSDEFQEADVDGNGRVSAEEIANLLASRAARMSRT